MQLTISSKKAMYFKNDVFDISYTLFDGEKIMLNGIEWNIRILDGTHFLLGSALWNKYEFMQKILIPQSKGEWV